MLALRSPGECVRPTTRIIRQARPRAERRRAARHPCGRRCSPGRNAEPAPHRGGRRPARRASEALRDAERRPRRRLRRARPPAHRQRRPDMPGCGALDNTARTSTAPRHHATRTSTRRRPGRSPPTAPEGTPISGDGVTVAVVDSGVDLTHQDLAGRWLSEARLRRRRRRRRPDGPHGHGTHVSGTIAALRDNGVGIVGVAPEAELMALRALDDDGSGFDSDIADAFRYAGQHGARVVNASLGGSGPRRPLDGRRSASTRTRCSSCRPATAAPTTTATTTSRTSGPCNSPSPNVVCVGASRQPRRARRFSNYGAETVDLFAPGVTILSTIPLDTVEHFETRSTLYLRRHVAWPLRTSPASRR